MSLHMNNILNEKSEIDFSKICRSCMCQKVEMKEIFGSCLDNMLRTVSCVDVKLGDGLPDKMCVPCVLLVSRAFTFKQQCQKADATFRMYLMRKETEGNQVIESSLPGVQETEAEIIPMGLGQMVEDQRQVMECPERDEDVQDDSHAQEEIAEENVYFHESLATSEEINFENLQIQDAGIELSKVDLLPEDCCDEVLATVKDLKVYEPKIYHICNNCGLTFPSPEELAVHNRENHPEELQISPAETHFECQECHKTFADSKILRRHSKTHLIVKPHVCLTCGKTFAESSNLTKHKKKHTGELRNVVGKPNLCSVCGKRFKWASSLSKHMKHHTKHKILTCPYCPKYYVEARSLSIHMRTHTGEKPFVCEICNKGFTQLCNLTKHIRVHTGEKPYLCPVCGKGFKQSGYVAIHLRTHTGERPYVCPDCGRAFAGSNTLALHRRCHTGERPYACSVCPKRFARHETAVIHQRIHTGEKPHVCQLCGRGFNSSGHLYGHMRSHNANKPYECDVCKKRFKSSSSLNVHIRSHTGEKPYSCPMCKKSFSQQSTLSTHQLTHLSTGTFVVAENQILEPEPEETNLG
ncbi:zinc finger protein ZFP2-like [Lutzomyia longipalpis]|uniref:zinc finger protein ZFP2-like n=1 Tax=Lutzomyia longipalpis TaxID=7200 RepID=UPI0024837791|nr:zinc finger protein ZFP2-like [Lutzomyia longipalpis]